MTHFLLTEDTQVKVPVQELIDKNNGEEQENIRPVTEELEGNEGI